MTPFDHISSTRLPLRTWREGMHLYRIHRAGLDGAWFGPAPGSPPTNRFDDPDGTYRICYLGATLEASFAETLLRNPPRRLLALSDLRARAVTTFRLLRKLRITRIHGEGLARLGLTADIIHGPYDMCGLLARVLWKHADTPDGLEYRSRHDDGHFCIALFDRAEEALVTGDTSGLADDMPRLLALLRRYGAGL